MDFLIFAASLVGIFVFGITACIFLFEQPFKSWVVNLSISIISFILCVLCVWSMINNINEGREETKKKEKIAYEHRFDNDVVILKGYDINDELQDYLSHGYELSGNVSGGGGYVIQTVVRKKK